MIFLYSIGVFTPERALHSIMPIDAEMRKSCNVTYLPYASLEHLEFLYENNADKLDAFLFSGSYPFEVIQKRFGELSRPHAYFNISDRDYYKLLARLAIQEPGLDFSRVYFDAPENSVDFASVFGRPGLPLIGSAAIDWHTVHASDWYAPLKEYYLQVWQSGKADLLVTRFSSMDEYFRQHNIRHEFLSPSPESMLETFHGLLMQVNTQVTHDSAACIGLLGFGKVPDKEQWETLRARLFACNKQLGMPFLLYERSNRFELTTSTAVLKEITQQYTTGSVISFLSEGLDFPLYLGWGCANNVIDAHRGAQRAFKEAMLSKESAAYIVTSDNNIIGPLSSLRRILYNDAPNSDITRLSRRLSLSPLYISKIISVLRQKGSRTLTADELAFYLDLSTRSASRILSKLEAGGVATVQYNRQINLRGRPTKIYQISFFDPVAPAP